LDCNTFFKPIETDESILQDMWGKKKFYFQW